MSQCLWLYCGQPAAGTCTSGPEVLEPVLGLPLADLDEQTHTCKDYTHSHSVNTKHSPRVTHSGLQLTWPQVWGEVWLVCSGWGQGVCGFLASGTGTSHPFVQVP